MDHYSALWNMGVSVDIIDQTKPLDGYSAVISPFSYMLRGDYAQRVDAYIKNGGTFVTTYGTGWVDENDLCFLGGFPGPLSDALGIWDEETDVLKPGKVNSAVVDGKEYAITDYCALVHAKGAKVLAEYAQDFYMGMPALTVNEYGEGKAYYVAARFGVDFLMEFYEKLMKELNVDTLQLPEGVTAAHRTDGEKTYTFVMNFAPCDKFVTARGVDFVTGETVESFNLPAHGVKILVK